MTPQFNEKIYIAAPFFNDQQVAVVASIEEMLEVRGHTVLSPRRQHSDGKVGIRDRHHAQDVLETNKRWIQHCDTLLAVIDWHVLPGQEVRLVEPLSTVLDGSNQPVNFHSPPLNIPDSGTVWELGYAEGIRTPTVLFTTSQKGGKVNVMLASSAAGVLFGWDDLARFATLGYTAVAPFKGPFQ